MNHPNVILWIADVTRIFKGDPWTVTFAHAALTGIDTLVTNVPTYRWPGAERLYLYRIANDDSTAGDHVGINRCEMIGWKP